MESKRGQVEGTMASAELLNSAGGLLTSDQIKRRLYKINTALRALVGGSPPLRVTAEFAVPTDLISATSAFEKAVDFYETHFKQLGGTNMQTQIERCQRLLEAHWVDVLMMQQTHADPFRITSCSFARD